MKKKGDKVAEKLEELENGLEELRKQFQQAENMFTHFRQAYFYLEDQIKIFKKLLKN